MTQEPPGSELSFSALVAALRWKIDNGALEKAFTSFEPNIGIKSLHDRQNIITQLDNILADLPFIQVMVASHRNSLVSINLLPIEVISRIFQQLYPSGNFPLFADLAPWLRSTISVCSHWRMVALSKPSFWRYIHFSNPHSSKSGGSLAMSFYNRSSPLPIYLRYSRPLGQASDAFHGIQQELVTAFAEAPERLGGLRVCTPGFPTELKPILKKTLPSLTTLILQPEIYTPDEGLERIVGNLDAPNLTRLLLKNICSIPKTLSGLTRLEIHINQRISTQYSNGTLFNILKQTPVLEILQLGGNCQYTTDSEQTSSVQLPCLMTVALLMGHTALTEALLTLHHMGIPQSTRISLVHTGSDWGGGHLIVPSAISERVTRVLVGEETKKLEVWSDALLGGGGALSHLSSYLPKVYLLIFQRSVRCPASSVLLGFSSIQIIHSWISSDTVAVFTSLKEEGSLFPDLVSWTFWLPTDEAINSDIAELLSAERFGEEGADLMGGETITLRRNNGTSCKAQMLRTKRQKFTLQWIKDGNVSEFA